MRRWIRLPPSGASTCVHSGLEFCSRPIGELFVLLVSGIGAMACGAVMGWLLLDEKGHAWLERQGL